MKQTDQYRIANGNWAQQIWGQVHIIGRKVVILVSNPRMRRADEDTLKVQQHAKPYKETGGFQKAMKYIHFLTQSPRSANSFRFNNIFLEWAIRYPVLPWCNILQDTIRVKEFFATLSNDKTLLRVSKPNYGISSMLPKCQKPMPEEFLECEDDELQLSRSLIKLQGANPKVDGVAPDWPASAGLIYHKQKNLQRLCKFHIYFPMREDSWRRVQQSQNFCRQVKSSFSVALINCNSNLFIF